MLWGKATVSLATFALVGISVVGCVSEPETEEQQSTSAEPSTAVGESASPEPTPSEIEPEELKGNPFDIPFPLEFTKDDLIEAALAEARIYMASDSSTKTVKVVFEEGFPDSEKSWITRIAQASVNVYPTKSGLVPLVAVGTTDAFISEAIRSNGYSFQGSYPCGRETTYETYCAGPNWAALNYMASALSPREFNNPGKKAVVAHELFHVWQLDLHSAPNGGNIDHTSARGVPLWLNEGLANFVGFAVAELHGIEGYQPGRDHQVVNYMMSSSVPLSEHIAWEHDPYGIGMAASEYLVASVGLEKVLRIWIELEMGKNFSEAFFEAIGVELSEFYEIFELARANFY